MIIKYLDFFLSTDEETQPFPLLADVSDFQDSSSGKN